MAREPHNTGKRSIGSIGARGTLFAAAGAGIAAAAGAWARHRAAPAVRGWRPGGGRMERSGDVAWRTFGAGDSTALLLHGLPGTNVMWGADYDLVGTAAHVMAIDLPGFGGSLESGAPGHTLGHAADVLDELVAGRTTPTGRLVACAHSYGSLVALTWAARRGDVDALVLVCPPLFRDAADGRARIARMARGAGLLAADASLARVLAGRAFTKAPSLVRAAAPIAVPHLPAAVARAGAELTWASFTAALAAVLACEWRSELGTVLAAGTRVVIVEGEADPLTVEGVSTELARRDPLVELVTVQTGDHELPMSHGTLVAELVLDALAGLPGTPRTLRR